MAKFRPNKVDELGKRRAMKKPALMDAEGYDPSQQEWLRRHGLEYSRRMTIPNDTEKNDAEWGLANNCAITRQGRDLLYVSFKHHKILRMPNTEHFEGVLARLR